MKKTSIIFGAIVIVLLMVSSATAVPQTHSQTKIIQMNEKDMLIDNLKEIIQKSKPCPMLGWWILLALVSAWFGTLAAIDFWESVVEGDQSFLEWLLDMLFGPNFPSYN